MIKKNKYFFINYSFLSNSFRSIVFIIVYPKKKLKNSCKYAKKYCILVANSEKSYLIMNKKIFFVPALAISMLMGNIAQAQNNDDVVAVYRWFSKVDRNYITVAEGEFQEGQMLNWHWTDKTLLFYAFKTPGPNRVAVYRWFNPTTKDWVSVAEDEFSDDQMLKMGYTEKNLQFYAPTRRDSNRVAVYRWHVPKTRDWVTIPEEGRTDLYIKKGYGRKTFQYYGVKRSVDESLYHQPLN